MPRSRLHVQWSNQEAKCGNGPTKQKSLWQKKSNNYYFYNAFALCPH